MFAPETSDQEQSYMTDIENGIVNAMIAHFADLGAGKLKQNQQKIAVQPPLLDVEEAALHLGRTKAAGAGISDSRRNDVLSVRAVCDRGPDLSGEGESRVRLLVLRLVRHFLCTPVITNSLSGARTQNLRPLRGADLTGQRLRCQRYSGAGELRSGQKDRRRSVIPQRIAILINQ